MQNQELTIHQVIPAPADYIIVWLNYYGEPWNWDDWVEIDPVDFLALATLPGHAEPELYAMSTREMNGDGMGIEIGDYVGRQSDLTPDRRKLLIANARRKHKKEAEKNRANEKTR